MFEVNCKLDDDDIHTIAPIHTPWTRKDSARLWAALAANVCLAHVPHLDKAISTSGDHVDPVLQVPHRSNAVPCNLALLRRAMGTNNG